MNIPDDLLQSDKTLIGRLYRSKESIVFLNAFFYFAMVFYFAIDENYKVSMVFFKIGAITLIVIGLFFISLQVWDNMRAKGDAKTAMLEKAAKKQPVGKSARRSPTIMTGDHTVIVERTATGFSAYVEGLSGACCTTGSTIAEIKQNMREAVDLYFDYEFAGTLNFKMKENQLKHK